MAYDKEELLNLPVAEKYELVLDLWESIDDDFLGKEMTRQGFEEEIDYRATAQCRNFFDLAFRDFAKSFGSIE